MVKWNTFSDSFASSWEEEIPGLKYFQNTNFSSSSWRNPMLPKTCQKPSVVGVLHVTNRCFQCRFVLDSRVESRSCQNASWWSLQLKLKCHLSVITVGRKRRKHLLSQWVWRGDLVHVSVTRRGISLWPFLATDVFGWFSLSKLPYVLSNIKYLS